MQVHNLRLGGPTGGVKLQGPTGLEEEGRKTRGEEFIIYRSYIITVLGTNGEVYASCILLSRSHQQDVTSSEPAPA